MKKAKMEKNEYSQFLRKDLFKSFWLSFVTIAILLALYYVWK
jgi:hypothetical protein